MCPLEAYCILLASVHLPSNGHLINNQITSNLSNKRQKRSLNERMCRLQFYNLTFRSFPFEKNKSPVFRLQAVVGPKTANVAHYNLRTAVMHSPKFTLFR